MLVAICSDLHLEFGDVNLENTEGADVLVLSGDILVARDLSQHTSGPLKTFFDNVTARFPHVVYVMGNHEHYHGDFTQTHDTLQKHLGHHANLHILDRGTFTLGNTVFAGSTLWTSMNKRNPLTMSHLRYGMHDFQVIKNSAAMTRKRMAVIDPDGGESTMVPFDVPGKFTPEHAADAHDLCLEFLSQTYAGLLEDQQMVVVGHHTPSFKSSHPRFAMQFHMNGGYHSDLYNFIADRPKIVLWTHGHTHDRYDYRIRATRVVCNARGYDGHEDVSKFKLKFVEV